MLWVWGLIPAKLPRSTRFASETDTKQKTSRSILVGSGMQNSRNVILGVLNLNELLVVTPISSGLTFLFIPVFIYISRITSGRVG